VVGSWAPHKIAHFALQIEGQTCYGNASCATEAMDLGILQATYTALLKDLPCQHIGLYSP
jgi:hypothetical protein